MANFDRLNYPNVQKLNNFPSGYTDFEGELDTVSKVNDMVDYLNNTLSGTITGAIKEKIDQGFIEGLYNAETETLVLTLSFE